MSTDEHGVSIHVRESALGALLDAPAQPVLRHFQSRRSARTLCGGTTGYTADHRYDVTCTACLTTLARRR